MQITYPDGEYSVFTPIGRVALEPQYCAKCHDESRQEHQRHIHDESKSHARTAVFFTVVSIGSLVVIPLKHGWPIAPGPAFPVWFFVPLVVALGSLLLAFVFSSIWLDTNRQKKKPFDIAQKLVTTNMFAQAVADIAGAIDVTHLRIKHTKETSLGPVRLTVEEFGRSATIDDLLVVVREPMLDNLCAIDFSDDRYWYRTEKKKKDSLIGIDSQGEKGGFKKFMRVMWDLQKGHATLLKDDPNAMLALADHPV